MSLNFPTFWPPCPCMESCCTQVLCERSFEELKNLVVPVNIWSIRSDDWLIFSTIRMIELPIEILRIFGNLFHSTFYFQFTIHKLLFASKLLIRVVIHFFRWFSWISPKQVRCVVRTQISVAECYFYTFILGNAMHYCYQRVSRAEWIFFMSEMQLIILTKKSSKSFLTFFHKQVQLELPISVSRLFWNI